MATTKPVLRDRLVGVASEMSSSSAVTFCWSEHGLPLESLSSTRTCVGWLAVAECRPGPLTRHVQEANCSDRWGRVWEGGKGGKDREDVRREF